MHRYYLVLLGLAALATGLITPVSTRAAHPVVPVILVHGQGIGVDQTWSEVINHLEAEGYQSGSTLFVLDLTQTGGEEQELGLFVDIGHLLQEIQTVRTQTGAPQVDLVGHSRGGLIVRFLAAGDTAALVRRAVSINTPHDGVLTELQFQGLLEAAGASAEGDVEFPIPADLKGNSLALQAVRAREARFPDLRAPALALASTWQDGLPPVLAGHDGVVSLESQLAWPGSVHQTFRLGPSPGEFREMGSSNWYGLFLYWNSPHVKSLRDPAVLHALTDYLLAPRVPPIHGSPAPSQPRHPATRADFLHLMARRLGFSEHWGLPVDAALAHHWAAGYVQAFQALQILPDSTQEPFRPDDPITRGEAAWLVGVTRRLLYPPGAARMEGEEPPRICSAGASGLGSPSMGVCAWQPGTK